MAKSTKTCPVCGFGYRGRLDVHLNKPIWGGVPGGDVEEVPAGWMARATRCDWNLNTVRIKRDAAALQAAGFVRAGVVARVITPLQATHPHLVRYDTTGIPHPTASPSIIGRDHDPKVWWCKQWVRAIASFDTMRMVVRRAVIKDLDQLPEACQVVETTLALGGWQAVRRLGPEVIPARCWSPWGLITIHREAGKGADTCILAKGHAGKHAGLRGSSW